MIFFWIILLAIGLNICLNRREKEEYVGSFQPSSGMYVNMTIMASDREEVYEIIQRDYPDSRIDCVYNTGRTNALKYYSEKTLEEYEGIVSRVNGNNFTFFPNSEHSLYIRMFDNNTFKYIIDWKGY